MSGSQTARDKVEAWITGHGDKIGTLRELRRIEDPSYSLNAWFETPQFLIDISAWDNASCLDIEALNATTEETEFCVTGPCEDDGALFKRLEEFLRWIEVRENRAT
jgi:hypothetical protein